MINQTTTLQRARMPMIAIVAFALGALASAAAPQLHLIASAPVTTLVISQTPSLDARPIVSPGQPAATASCDRSAYVTGDMAGDASPAAVYSTMCGK